MKLNLIYFTNFQKENLSSKPIMISLVKDIISYMLTFSLMKNDLTMDSWMTYTMSTTK